MSKFLSLAFCRVLCSYWRKVSECDENCIWRRLGPTYVPTAVKNNIHPITVRLSILRPIGEDQSNLCQEVNPPDPMTLSSVYPALHSQYQCLSVTALEPQSGKTVQFMPLCGPSVVFINHNSLRPVTLDRDKDHVTGRQFTQPFSVKTLFAFDQRE